MKFLFNLVAARPFSRLRRLLPQAESDTLEPGLYRFILRHSRGEQLYLVVVTLASLPVFYYSLDLPKIIINKAIAGKHFPQKILGISFDQVSYLLVLCSIFFALVLISGWFKYHLNVRRGQVGERMLRRLRYQLFERVLRFPMQHFDRTATGEIVAMMTAELEPVGGFVGDAFALPISQGGTLLTILVFMFVQNPVLGAAAVALYPLQGYVIPKLQRRIRALGRERVRMIRRLSDRIAEAIAGRVEIRTNDGAAYQLAGFAARLGEIYNVRLDIYNRKFFVKSLNNMLNQLTPFFFYFVGGYLVIKHELSLGALVAVLAAYKDLASPWKELLDYYQNQQDVAIKYEQVVEQFQVGDLVDKKLLLEQPETVEPLAGDVAAVNVDLLDGDGFHELTAINFTFPLGTHIAVVGQLNSGKNLLPQLLARLTPPTQGRLSIGGRDLNGLPFAVSGRSIAYVGPASYLFSTSVRDNLLLGLLYRPLRPPERDADAAARRSREAAEARRAGNLDWDPDADWVDYQQAGAADAAELEDRMIAVLRLVALDEDVYFFGLRGRLDPQRDPKAAASVVAARRRLSERLAARGLGGLVERFDPERYHAHLPIAQNLLFGTPIGPIFEGDALAGNPYVQEVLDREGLTPILLEAGAQVARTMIELFAQFRPEHEFFEEFSFIGAEDLPAFERILGHLDSAGLAALPASERERLLAVAMKLVAARNRLGLIDEDLQQRILRARHAFAAGLPDHLKGAVEFFDPDRYDRAASLEQNVLFGTIAPDEADGREQVQAAIVKVLDEIGLRGTVMALGLDYRVGVGGSRLSPAQRQKLAIARALLKRPELIVLNEATAVLDGATEAAIVDRIKAERSGASLFFSLPRPRLAAAFDRVLVMDQGRIVEDGPYRALQQEDGPLAPLLAAE
ncbi:MAG TPA: ABC transporter transmembrane domain-containing protein [Stellaceae bacterium]|nr:ABC transporter transmembrane domain-containing protein [Stellaceae bacterium]